MNYKLFRVTIYYDDGSKNDVSVIAVNDVNDRSKAIDYDAKVYQSAKAKLPEIDFCEIKLIETNVQR